MNFHYLKNLVSDIRELGISQFIIVIVLFVQVSIVTRGLGTSRYGQAVLVLALIAIIFRMKKFKKYYLSLLFDESFPCRPVPHVLLFLYPRMKHSVKSVIDSNNRSENTPHN